SPRSQSSKKPDGGAARDGTSSVATAGASVGVTAAACACTAADVDNPEQLRLLRYCLSAACDQLCAPPPPISSSSGSVGRCPVARLTAMVTNHSATPMAMSTAAMTYCCGSRPVHRPARNPQHPP